MENEKKELKGMIFRVNEILKISDKLVIDKLYDLKKINLAYFDSIGLEDNNFHYSEFISDDIKLSVKLLFLNSEKLLIIQDENKYIWKYRRLLKSQNIQQTIESSFYYPLNNVKEYIPFVNWTSKQALLIQGLVQKN